MLLTVPELQALRTLTADGRLLMLTRVVRLVAYGCLSVVFALYLAALGLTEQQIGLVLTLTLVGDAMLSLWIAMVADRLGRRRMLMLGAGLMVGAGLVFGVSSSLALLLLAAFVGTISPSGGGRQRPACGAPGRARRSPWCRTRPGHRSCPAARSALDEFPRGRRAAR